MDNGKGEILDQMNSLRIERRFSTTPHGLWQAWTDPQIVKLWFGSDPNGTVLDAVLDVRVGGAFAVTFANANGDEYTAQGIYQQVELDTKLAFTWGWKNQPHIKESVILQFQAQGNGTLMTFEHLDIDANTSHNYEIGWRSTFDKLEKALGRR
jgi:uncharacterized protein YndB with AHSA1/START domain